MAAIEDPGPEPPKSCRDAQEEGPRDRKSDGPCNEECEREFGRGCWKGHALGMRDSLYETPAKRNITLTSGEVEGVRKDKECHPGSKWQRLDPLGTTVTLEDHDHP